MRAVLIALALAALPMTGCLGSDEPTSAGSSTAAFDEPAPAATMPDGAAAPNATVVEPMVMPYAWDGKIGRYACLPSGPSACTSPASLGDGDSMETFETNVTRFTVEISWTPAAPTTTELAATVFLMTPCGDGCLEWTGSLADVSGPSPLTIDTPVEMPPGSMLGFHVTTIDNCHDAGGAVFTCINAVEQPFHVEGEMATVA